MPVLLQTETKGAGTALGCSLRHGLATGSVLPSDATWFLSDCLSSRSQHCVPSISHSPHHQCLSSDFALFARWINTSGCSLRLDTFLYFVCHSGSSCVKSLHVSPFFHWFGYISVDTICQTYANCRCCKRFLPVYGFHFHL